jgi:hypothetical protein
MFSAGSGGGLVFSTNLIKFFFQGQTTGFVPINQAPASGTTPDPYLSYTNVVPAVASALPLGQLAISSVAGGKAALSWDLPGTLQVGGSLLGGSWTNLPAATSPYIVPASGGQLFFRLTQ